MSKFGISHNHKQKKDKILNDILHSQIITMQLKSKHIILMGNNTK